MYGSCTRWVTRTGTWIAGRTSRMSVSRSRRSKTSAWAGGGTEERGDRLSEGRIRCMRGGRLARPVGRNAGRSPTAVDVVEVRIPDVGRRAPWVVGASQAARDGAMQHAREDARRLRCGEHGAQV